MARERMKSVCDCGCGREVYHNQLVQVIVETPVDETLRQAKTRQRFWVTAECEQPYKEELILMHKLMEITVHYAPRPRTRYWLINAWLNPFYPWPWILRDWWRRVGGAVRVMKLQHAIYERTKGFDYARERALQSAVLCGAPRFMQGFLAKRYMLKARKKAAAKCDHPRENQIVGRDSVITCTKCKTTIGMVGANGPSSPAAVKVEA